MNPPAYPIPHPLRPTNAGSLAIMMRPFSRLGYALVLALTIGWLMTGPAPAAAQLADGVWPRAGYDEGNTRQSPFGAEATSWEIVGQGGGDRSISWPTVAADGSLLYVNSAFFRFEAPEGEATLYALNPDGTPRWNAPVPGIPGEAISAPAIDAAGNIFVVVASADESRGIVDVFNMEGEPISFASVDALDEFNEGDLAGDQRGGAAQTPLLDGEGRMFVRMEGTLVAFALPDELDEANVPELLWREPIGPRCLNMGPDGSLYAATGSTLHRIDPSTGEELNSIPVVARQEGCPAIDAEGNVYVSNDLDVERWAPDLSTRDWVYDGLEASNEPPGYTPVLAPDGGSLYFVSEPDGFSTVRLFALDTDTGEAQWQVAGESQFFDSTAPSVRGNGTIYFSASGEIDSAVGPEGRLYGVQPDGSLFFTREYATATDDAPVIMGPPVFSSTGAAYFTTAGGFFSPAATHIRAEVLPQVVLSDESLDFGPVEVGESVEQILTVQNEGGATVVIEELLLSEAVDAFALALEAEELPPGASANITITFTPETSGVVTSVLTVGTSVGTLEATLSGEGVVTSLTLDPLSVDFGPVEVGGTAEEIVDLINDGTEPVLVEDVFVADEFDEGLFTVSPSSGELEAGESLELTVTFTPVEEGFVSATLIVESSAGVDEATIGGEGVVSAIALEPTAVDFGAVEVGTAEEVILTLTNEGSTVVSVEDVELSGDVEAFAVDFSPQELSPEEELEMAVTFAPNEAGPVAATLTVFTSAGEASATLAGEGVEFSLTVDPASVDFGLVEVGETLEEIVVLINDGSASLVIEDVIDEGPFTVSPSSGELEPGESLELTVTFAPLESGPAEATLTIISTAGTDEVPLSGEGVVQAIALVPGELDFGAVEVGRSAETTLELLNEGGTTVQVEDVVLTGADADAFTVESASGDVGPGDQLVIDVRFSPLAEGVAEATLTVTTSAGDEEAILIGEGVVVTVVTDNTPVAEGQDVLLEVGIEGLVPAAATLLFRRGGDATFEETPMSVSGGTLSASVPGGFVTARGLDYAVMLETEEDVRRFPEDSARFFHRRVTVPEVSAGGTFTAETYRMVSLPADAQNPDASAVLASFGTPDPEVWRLLRWSAAEEAYEEYPDTGFAFTPGRAFWLISREGNGFEVADLTTVDAAEPFSLTLASGWNQIGVPFAFSIPWAAVTLDDGTPPASAGVQPPVAFDGAAYLPEVAELRPWEGYFVFNESATPVTIRIPSAESSALVESKTPTHLATEGFGFRLRVADDRAGVHDPHTYLWAGSEHGRSLRKAPPIGRQLQAAVVDSSSGPLARAVVLPSAEGAVWDVDVRRHGGRALESWQVEGQLEVLADLPATFEVQVLDAQTGSVVSTGMSSFNLTLTAGHPVQHLQVVAGTRAFLEDQQARLTAAREGLAVQPPYPNPTRGTATLTYHTAEAAHVHIAVYDVLGRHVATLADAEHAPGRHTLVWDGTDATGRSVASGVYFYRIRAGAHIHSGSFTRIR